MCDDVIAHLIMLSHRISHQRLISKHVCFVNTYVGTDEFNKLFIEQLAR